MIVLSATDLAAALILGGALGGGLLLLVTRLPRIGAPSLTRRIAPYLRDIADPRGLTPLSSSAPARAAWIAVRERLGRMAGGADAVARRLRQAGLPASPTHVAAFRARQLLWAVAGLTCGGLLVVGVVLTGRFTPIAAALPLVVAVAAALVCEALLTRAARVRVGRVQDELPTVLEFLALCLSAGEGILDALRRVGAVGAGELTAEIRAVVLAVGTGSTLTDALSALARGLDVSALTRAVDHVIAALDRGAPLAQVLQAQAADARDDAKRTLIEAAGRKEILMLLPLVFLILPLSVLFAVFPGVFLLRLGLG